MSADSVASRPIPPEDEIPTLYTRPTKEFVCQRSVGSDLASELKVLELGGCKISAHALANLSKLKLIQLSLGESAVDDNVGQVLGSFKSLTILGVNVGKAQEERLKKLLPKCQVVHITPLAQRHSIMAVQQ